MTESKRGLRERLSDLPQDHPVVSSIALVAVAVGAALIVALSLSGKPREALELAAISLVFVALLGGFVKILLDNSQRNRENRAEEIKLNAARDAAKRDEQTQFLTGTLAALKAVYDRVERARIVIRAHRSAVTYENEMRALIDACVELRNVARSLEAGTSGITPARESCIRSVVATMEGYLQTLTSEFGARYGAIAEAQRLHEARIETLLKSVDDSTALPPNQPWEKIEWFPELRKFIDNPASAPDQPGSKPASPRDQASSRDYKEEFTDPLDKACKLLREELLERLQEKPTMAPRRRPARPRKQ